jgi:hypothetical protein
MPDSGFARTPAGDTSRIRCQVSQLHPGAIVEVRFISQEKVRARLASSDAGAPIGVVIVALAIYLKYRHNE